MILVVQVDEVGTHVDARLKDPVNQYPAILGERHPVFRRDDYASFNLVPRSCCLVMVLCVCGCQIIGSCAEQGWRNSCGQ